MKYKILLSLFLTLYCNILFSQNSFEITFHSPLDEAVWDFIENTDHKIIAVGWHDDPGYNLASHDGMIWVVGSPSDTLTRSIDLNDTALIFNYIEQMSNGNYLIIGNIIYPPVYNIGDAIAYELDTQFNIVSKKIIHSIDDAINELRFVKHFGENYYLFGVGDFNHDRAPVIIKLDDQLNVVDSTIFWEHIGAMTPFMDCLFKEDSIQLWAFTNSMTSIYNSPDELMVLDSSLNVISKKKFPSHINGYIHDVDYGSRMSAEWMNDSDFVVGCDHRVIDFSIPPTAEHDIGLSLLDSTLTLSPIVYAGAPDTMDYAADLRCIDALNSNEIFYAGTKRHISEFYPQKPSWIIAGKIDQNLQKQYELYYGEDAYYKTMTIKAANDGGSIISAWRHDYLTQNNEYDVHFLKLNGQGIVTNNNTLEKPGYNNFNIYPNPLQDIIWIDSRCEHASMSLYDICGRKLMSADLHFGTNEFSISELEGQVLIIKVLENNNETYSYKIVKVKK